MARIIFMKGLPASGKTTLGIKMLDNGEADVRVNKDDLRKMLFKNVFKDENHVVDIERYIVRKMLGAGKTVIIDNTHFNPIHEKEYRTIALAMGAEFDMIYLDTDVDECVWRDSRRLEGFVGETVIRNMWERALRKSYA